MKNELKRFMLLHPELELVEADDIHKELHQTDEDWFIFINRGTEVVEVHDVKTVNNDDIITSHIMTEPNVTWKIVHDARKYNSKVYDINETLDFEEAIEDNEAIIRRIQQGVARVKKARDILMHNV